MVTYNVYKNLKPLHMLVSRASLTRTRVRVRLARESMHMHGWSEHRSIHSLYWLKKSIPEE